MGLDVVVICELIFCSVEVVCEEGGLVVVGVNIDYVVDLYILIE